MSAAGRLPHLTIGLLGVVTICTYGSWYYSFGVLLDPIIEDTGWSETALSGSFSAGIIVLGAGSMLGGRLLDRLGTRPVFLLAAFVGGTAFFVASAAQDPLVFATGSALGMGLFGALGFYHVTMTAAVRAAPEDPARAIAVLTIWGAFASAIYLPIAAWLVDNHSWRFTARVLVGSAMIALLLAALVTPVAAAADRDGPRPSLRSIAAATIERPGPRAFTAAVAMAGIAISTLLVYQVPLMVAAGLPLTTAATMAAVRGFAQLGGRLPLTPLLRRFGSRIALMMAFAAIGIGVLLLTVAGSIPVALLFAAAAGFGIGAFSPLQGIYAEELFDRETLGVTMGFYSAVMMLSGAIGPALAGKHPAMRAPLFENQKRVRVVDPPAADQQRLLGKGRRRNKARVFGIHGHEGTVDPAVGQIRRQLHRVACCQPQVHIRPIRKEPVDQGRQPDCGGALHRAQPERTPWTRVKDGILGLLRQVDQAVRIVEQHGPGGRQPHTSRLAQEQRAAQIGLQVLDAGCHGGLHAPQALGRTGDPPLGGDGAKCGQVAEVHLFFRT